MRRVSIRPVHWEQDTMSPQAEALIALLQRRVVWQATGAVMVAWFFGYYAFGFWWSLWLVPLFYTWERIHSRRFVRQQVQKYADLVQERDEPEVETVEWINRMMLIAWPTMGPYISNIIMEKSVDALEANKPMMVSRMCLEGVTMGMVPPILSDVIVYKSDANILDIECTINLDSQIAMEMAAYTKPARVPILVKEPQFQARSRVTAWLIPREPFLSQMRVSFLERPDIDVTVKPISVGPDVINLVPGLSGAIKDMFIGMFSDQWIHPKYLEIVLEEPEGSREVAPQAVEKAKKKGMLGSSVGAIGGVGSAGAGLVGSGVGAVGAGVGKVGAVGANTTKAVGGAAVGGAKAVGGAAAGGAKAVGGAAAGGAKAVGGAAAAGIGGVGKLGSSGVNAISGGIGKVNPFGKKKSVDEKNPEGKETKKESSGTFSNPFGKKKDKKKVEADSESAREVSGTEDASEEGHARVEKEKSKKSLFGFGRSKSSKKIDEDAKESSETNDREASETSEDRKHHRKHKDSERKHRKKHRKHRDGDDEDGSEVSEASEGAEEEERTERSERHRKTRKHKSRKDKEEEEKEKEDEEEHDHEHHSLSESVSESVSHMTESLSSFNPFGKKEKKHKKDKKEKKEKKDKKDKSSKE